MIYENDLVTGVTGLLAATLVLSLLPQVYDVVFLDNLS